MRTLTYVVPGGDPDNKEDTVVFASRLVPGIDALLSKNLSGLGGLTAEISTVKVVGKPGEIVQKVSLPPRIITDTCSLIAKEKKEIHALRRRIVRLLNPLSGPGTLIIKDPGGEYSIEAIPKTNAADVGKIASRACKVSVEFFCPDPYFRSLIADEALLLSTGKGLVFGSSMPWQLCDDTRNFSVLNASSQDAELVVTVSGQCTNVRIGINEEWVVIPVVMESYDRLTIDSKRQRVVLAHQGTSKVIYPSLDSVFPRMSPGVNTFGVGFDTCSANVKVSVSWTPSYLGV